MDISKSDLKSAYERLDVNIEFFKSWIKHYMKEGVDVNIIDIINKLKNT